MLSYPEGIKICEFWQTYAPQMRFMQFINNFINWEACYNGVDAFYLSDDILIKHLQDFCKKFF